MSAKETTSTIAADPSFNLETVYDDQIAPLMTQVIDICKRHKMPMLATFCYGYSAETDRRDYCTTTLPRDGWQAPEIEQAVKIIRHGVSGSLVAALITKMS